MEYRLVLNNYYLQLTIHTNSRRLHSLAGNFFDFERYDGKQKKRIKISINLEELKLGQEGYESKFLYQSVLKRGSALSYFHAPIVTVTTNIRTGTVKAAITGYADSLKEKIIDFSTMQPLYLILARLGFFGIHASVISKNGKCVLISGPKRCGKSTIALTLWQNGFNLLSDDDCFIKIVGNRIEIFPFPTAMGLHENILKRYPNVAKYVLKDYNFGGKKRMLIKNVPSPHDGACRCQAVVFPGYESAEESSLKEITRADGLKKLTKQRLGLLPETESKRLVWTLYRFAKETRFFELNYRDRDLSKIPAIIGQIIGA